jgi:hypothetical protein
MSEDFDSSDAINPTYVKTDYRNLDIEAHVGDKPDVSSADPSLDEVRLLDQKDKIEDMELFLKE